MRQKLPRDIILGITSVIHSANRDGEWIDEQDLVKRMADFIATKNTAFKRDLFETGCKP